MSNKTFSVNIQNIVVENGLGKTELTSLGSKLSWADARKLADENKNSVASIHPMNRDYGNADLSVRHRFPRVKRFKESKKRKRTN